MGNKFKNKVVFITGAGEGQGRAVAKAFAKKGAKVAGFDLASAIPYPQYNRASKDKLASLESEIREQGGEFLPLYGDVRKKEDIKAAVDAVIHKFKKIDILFNNAGICAYGECYKLSEDEWDAVLDINLKGAFLVGREIIPYLIEEKSGVIINNSSVAGLRGMNRLSHYVASKWGLTGLSKSWAIELAPYNIRVVSLHPTGVNTPLNDGLAEMEGTTALEIAERSAGNLLDTPWLEVEDVVNSVLFLASDKARFITGSEFVIDAGLLTR